MRFGSRLRVWKVLTPHMSVLSVNQVCKTNVILIYLFFPKSQRKHTKTNEENIFFNFIFGPDKVFDLVPTYSHKYEKLG